MTIDRDKQLAESDDKYRRGFHGIDPSAPVPNYASPPWLSLDDDNTDNDFADDDFDDDANEFDEDEFEDDDE